MIFPPFYPDTQLVREYLAAYYDEIHRMDSDFGEVLRYLDEHGLSDDTIVIFMGDNGGAQFMAKGTLYENGIRVPFLVRWPGRIAPAVTDAVVSNVDIASTCLAAAGLPVPEEMEGADLLPLMVQGETPAERWVYSVRSCHATNSLPGKTSVFDQMRCIVGERYKLIYNLLPGLPWVPVDFSGTEMFAELKRMHKSGVRALRPAERPLRTAQPDRRSGAERDPQRPDPETDLQDDRGRRFRDSPSSENLRIRTEKPSDL